MMYADDDFIQLSAVQHYAFCPRQCALIHREMVWSENQATAEGRILHEKADSGGVEKRGDLKQATGVLLRSQVLGVSGKADMVEFHREGKTWKPYPVEYKRGNGSSVREDSIQLCLQAICLEEMLNIHIPEGSLFYGKIRRRKQIVFSEDLRLQTKNVVLAVHELLGKDSLPMPLNDGRCPQCSLYEQCRPEEVAVPARAVRYLEALRRME
ncbi:MAG: CRISPR-associated protein Cas4 [Desulfovibrio sp.]|jgi:CRISPR-associated exonuclease Cas4|nr:CRISPR-associated protein Cas4 [Desulfovibrio sp.]